MKVKDFFGRNINVNCFIELWDGAHNYDGKLLQKAYGDESDLFKPWYDIDIVYITINETGSGIILEVAK